MNVAKGNYAYPSIRYNQIARVSSARRLLLNGTKSLAACALATHGARRRAYTIAEIPVPFPRPTCTRTTFQHVATCRREYLTSSLSCLLGSSSPFCPSSCLSSFVLADVCIRLRHDGAGRSRLSVFSLSFPLSLSLFLRLLLSHAFLNISCE